MADSNLHLEEKEFFEAAKLFYEDAKDLYEEDCRRYKVSKINEYENQTSGSNY